MASKRTVYYTDELNDDFARTNISTKRVGAEFKFRRTGLLWRIVEFIAYYIIALPLVYVAAKLYLGLKIKNRRVIRKLRGTGFYLFGNHTRNLDAFVPALAAFPKKAMVVCNPDAVSIPGIKLFVQMLGALPLPTEFSGMMNFMNALFGYIKDRRCVAIYPEAHVWPFYTGIRPFKPDSFCYCVKTNSPAVAMVTRYRTRKGLFKHLPPAMTVTLSEPFYPDTSLGMRAGGQDLRDRVYEYMVRETAREGNVEYVRYVKQS